MRGLGLKRAPAPLPLHAYPPKARAEISQLRALEALAVNNEREPPQETRLVSALERMAAEWKETHG